MGRLKPPQPPKNAKLIETHGTLTAGYFLLCFVGQISLNYKKIVGLFLSENIMLQICYSYATLNHFTFINHSFTIVEENFKVLFSEKHQ